MRQVFGGIKIMGEIEKPRVSKPVASELADWEERASAGDEMAQRAVAKDPIAIATLRQEFAEIRKASY